MVTDKLARLSQVLCVLWVPKIFTNDHKTKMMGWTLTVFFFFFAMIQKEMSSSDILWQAFSFYLFLDIKQWLESQKFEDDEELECQCIA